MAVLLEFFKAISIFNIASQAMALNSMHNNVLNSVHSNVHNNVLNNVLNTVLSRIKIQRYNL